MYQILAVLTPSKIEPGSEGAVVDTEVAVAAVYGPALPHIFYILLGGTIGGATRSCCHDNF